MYYRANFLSFGHQIAFKQSVVHINLAFFQSGVVQRNCDSVAVRRQ